MAENRMATLGSNPYTRSGESMREIKFRGKTSIGVWLYGGFRQNWDVVDDKETMGEYTGLKDVDGREIYEGDIVESPKLPPDNARGVVVFKDAEYRIDGNDGTSSFLYWVWKAGGMKVVGNIHDNPELLGGEKDDGRNDG